MKEKTTSNSHHLLTSFSQYFNIDIGLRWTAGWCDSMRRVRFSMLWLAVAALLIALSPGEVLAKPKPRQWGDYAVTISGYYRGSGVARAFAGTVEISANVKDEAGKPHQLSAPALARDPERHYLFSGTGSLDGMEVSIDGRVDAPDPVKGGVLKAGRIVFTFKVIPNGKHGRGGGERTAGGGGGNGGGNGNGNNGNGNGNGGNGNGNNGNGNGGGNGSGNNGNGVGNGGGNGTGNEGNGGGNNGGSNRGGNGRGNNPGNGNRAPRQ